MLNLSALRAVEVTEVTIRGQAVPVRPLLASEVAMIEAQCPAPIVRGRSESEREVFASDPAFQARFRRHLRVQLALRCALAADVSIDGSGWSSSMDQATAEAFADRIMGLLSDTEIGMIDAARHRIEEPRASDIGTADVPGN